MTSGRGRLGVNGWHRGHTRDPGAGETGCERAAQGSHS